MLSVTYGPPQCTRKQRKLGVSQVDHSDKCIPGTSRYKSRFSDLKCSTRGFIRYQSSMRFPKGEKKRPGRQDKTVWDDLRLQSLEAFPAASGKFRKTKPDSIRKTGGNAVSGLDQELARRARRLKKHISPESVWPRLSVVMAKQTGGPAPSP